MKSCVKSSNKWFLIYTGAFLFLIFSFVFGLCLGSTKIGFLQFIEAIASFGKNGVPERIFWYVRLPRTTACILCGAALSVSGAVIQSVLANRLASPGIIGVNSGAGLAVTLCTAFGIYGGFRLSLFAFIGAFLSVLTVSYVSSRLGSSKSTVILLGVALNSLFGAFSDAVITFNPEIGIMRNDFKIGDFSAVTYNKLIPAAVISVIALLLILTLTNELDILSLGNETAESLGLNTKLLRMVFLILSALLAGCAVSIAGLLSFVGLIVPNLVRIITGNKSKHLLPLCVMFGGGFVSLCDTLSRTVFSPYEIPVGIIMSFLGVPFFIFILIKKKGGHTNA